MTASSKQGPGNSLAGMRILIVEDEMMVAMMLEDMLTDLGCDVIKAGRVAKAIQFVASTQICEYANRWSDSGCQPCRRIRLPCRARTQ
jgi:CheY-like chemotaxis protein